MRLFTRTLAPVPEPSPAPESPPPRVADPATVVVALVGTRHLADALGRHLPDGYRVRHVQDLGDVENPDAIVLTDATGGAVAAALLRHPSTPVIGLIDPLSPVQTLVGVLEAGADTCVRSGETVLLASHLLACLRRRDVLDRSVAPPPQLAEA